MMDRPNYLLIIEIAIVRSMRFISTLSQVNVHACNVDERE